MTTASEFPATVVIDETKVWAALENFFSGSVYEARQMRTRDFGWAGAFVSRSIPLLDIQVDGKSYNAAAHEVNKAGMYLAGATIRIAYFTDDRFYRYVMVELTNTGPASMPQAKPTAVQKRWEIEVNNY